MCKREATEHDTDYVEKYDDLGTTLIFVCILVFILVASLTCSRVVSSAFTNSQLQSNPNEQLAALLRATPLFAVEPRSCSSPRDLISFPRPNTER